jgi:outer membrane protein TolC
LKALRSLAVLLLLPALGCPLLAQNVPEGLGLLEAVRLTLENDPNIGLEEAQLAASRGGLTSASGRFDPVLGTSLAEVESRAPVSETSSRELSTLENVFGVTKQFRTGLSIEPQFQLLRTDDTGAGALNQGNLFFTIRQPLLRGRGRAATTAAELSAERSVRASELDVRHTVAQRVLAVGVQYWAARAALLNLAILEASERSARELLETTRRLVEADQTPAAELVQLEANLAFQESASIGGERELYEARRDLGREIGLDGARIAALPLPADPFPEVAPEEVPPPSDTALFVAEAMRRRADLEAARERRSGTEFLVRAAENTLKPQLDLIFIPSYSGLVEGTSADTFFSPLYSNVPGLSSSISFNLSWPTSNRRARGDLAQVRAAERQTELLIELLDKSIGADVPTALEAVRRNALQLDKSREAVRLFERTVVNEEKKLRAGTSTILDLISQRDRLTSARQTEVRAQLALALSILDLRFLTGTLIDEGEGPDSTSLARLTTLPVEEVRRP